MTSVLSGVHHPADLRALAPSALDRLAAEIRSELIATVSRTGGHLGPNLGVVELTIAVHRVFESPRDAVVFDTGHQAYVHKMLTGRAEALAGLRQPGGMSGYPSRAESPHDVVENSHASTALSYADGLAKAFAVSGRSDRRVVAVVGDGALTGGMCWEALNNIGAAPERPVIIVLNDNGRSYAPTVGGVARHLFELREGSAEPGLFTALGIGYVGPVDGHDIAAVEGALREALDRGVATVVHCVTRKGFGYAAAEADEADRMHTIGPAVAVGSAVPVGADAALGSAVPVGADATAPAGRSWTGIFGSELAAVGAERDDVVAVTAAMLRPTGLRAFAAAYPDRVYDVGIAEQHAVTSAAGLASGGLHPVVAIYATFVNRAFDQVLMDVALHRLPVTFVLDRAGITGPDGPSHHGMWDLSMLGIVPGMRVAAPRDACRLRELLREAVADDDGPTAIRFPKADVGADVPALGRLGRSDVLFTREGAEVLFVGAGPMSRVAVDAAERLERLGIPATVVDPRWVLPVDPALLTVAEHYGLVVTLEDNGLAGGLGDAFSRGVRAGGGRVPVHSIGLDQRFHTYGERGAMLAEQGLSAEAVAAVVTARLAALTRLDSLV